MVCICSSGRASSGVSVAGRRYLYYEKERRTIALKAAAPAARLPALGGAKNMTLLIKGGRVIDPANGVDGELDLLIEQGRVARLEAGLEAGAARVIDASGCLVLPGLIDMHVHLREPGQEHKEDIASGTAAAAAGGFTTVCCMPNTSPVNDSPQITARILERAREVGCVRVLPVAAITRGSRGEELCDFGALRAAGAVAVSDDGRGVMSAGLTRRALEAAAAADLPLIQHCEDEALSCNGAMNEGVIAARAGISSQPVQAESVMLARDVELVALTGARYHVAHISCAASLEHVRRARAAGLSVTCEAAPHHFTLTDEACLDGDARAKVNPPLRSADDRAALRAAISEGLVDAIATDHAPHAEEEKRRGFEEAPFGISGLETAVPLALALWRDGVVTLPRLVAMLTCNPARLLSLELGNLSPGAAADVTVIDPDRTWELIPAQMRSRGHNTPFAGQTLRGAVRATVAGGQVVFE
jgi:dihydroorotase